MSDAVCNAKEFNDGCIVGYVLGCFVTACAVAFLRLVALLP